MQYLLRAPESIRETITSSPRIYLALDYDGTLARLVPDRGRAFLPRATEELLRRLASNTRCVLTIVSGRRLSDITTLVGIEGAYYVGNHGLEIQGPRLRFVHAGAKAFSRYLPDITRELNEQLRGTRASVENRGLTLGVHYRKVRHRDMPTFFSTVKHVLQDYEMFETIYDKNVVDVRPNLSWDKGSALEVLIQRLGQYPMVYIGDDRTDEDAFRKLRNAITILVSQKPKISAAHYYLRGTRDVVAFLRLLNSWLETQRGNRTEKNRGFDA